MKPENFSSVLGHFRFCPDSYGKNAIFGRLEWGAGEARPIFSCASFSFQWMGVESSKVEYLLSGPGKKVQLAITFRGENLNFYGQMTRVQVMMASLRCIQIGLPGSLLPESGRENSSPTVALYSQRLHIIFHTLSIPSQRTNGHSLFTVRQRTSKIRVNLSPNKVISAHFF